MVWIAIFPFVHLMASSFVPQHTKRCLTPRGGRSTIRWGATLSPGRAHKEPGAVSSSNRSALILRTCSVTLIFLASRHAPSVKGILRATFKATKRRTEAASRILSEATCSICFQTFSRSTDAQTAAGFTARTASSAATQSLSAEETWWPHTQSAPDFYCAQVFGFDVNLISCSCLLLWLNRLVQSNAPDFTHFKWRA